jgi:hypothetical protein
MTLPAPTPPMLGSGSSQEGTLSLHGQHRLASPDERALALVNAIPELQLVEEAGPSSPMQTSHPAEDGFSPPDSARPEAKDADQARADERTQDHDDSGKIRKAAPMENGQEQANDDGDKDMRPPPKKKSGIEDKARAISSTDYSDSTSPWRKGQQSRSSSTSGIQEISPRNRKTASRPRKAKGARGSPAKTTQRTKFAKIITRLNEQEQARVAQQAYEENQRLATPEREARFDRRDDPMVPSISIVTSRRDNAAWNITELPLEELVNVGEVIYAAEIEDYENHEDPVVRDMPMQDATAAGSPVVISYVDNSSILPSGPHVTMELPRQQAPRSASPSEINRRTWTKDRRNGTKPQQVIATPKRQENSNAAAQGGGAAIAAASVTKPQQAVSEKNSQVNSYAAAQVGCTVKRLQNGITRKLAALTGTVPGVRKVRPPENNVTEALSEGVILEAVAEMNARLRNNATTGSVTLQSLSIDGATKLTEILKVEVAAMQEAPSPPARVVLLLTKPENMSGPRPHATTIILKQALERGGGATIVVYTTSNRMWRLYSAWWNAVASVGPEWKVHKARAAKVRCKDSCAVYALAVATAYVDEGPDPTGWTSTGEDDMMALARRKALVLQRAQEGKSVIGCGGADVAMRFGATSDSGSGDRDNKSGDRDNKTSSCPLHRWTQCTFKGDPNGIGFLRQLKQHISHACVPTFKRHLDSGLVNREAAAEELHWLVPAEEKGCSIKPKDYADKAVVYRKACLDRGATTENKVNANGVSTNAARPGSESETKTNSNHKGNAAKVKHKDKTKAKRNSEEERPEKVQSPVASEGSSESEDFLTVTSEKLKALVKDFKKTLDWNIVGKAGGASIAEAKIAAKEAALNRCMPNKRKTIRALPGSKRIAFDVRLTKMMADGMMVGTKQTHKWHRRLALNLATLFASPGKDGNGIVDYNMTVEKMYKELLATRETLGTSGNLALELVRNYHIDGQSKSNVNAFLNALKAMGTALGGELNTLAERSHVAWVALVKDQKNGMTTLEKYILEHVDEINKDATPSARLSEDVLEMLTTQALNTLKVNLDLHTRGLWDSAKKLDMLEKTTALCLWVIHRLCQEARHTSRAGITTTSWNRMLKKYEEGKFADAFISTALGAKGYLKKMDKNVTAEDATPTDYITCTVANFNALSLVSLAMNAATGDHKREFVFMGFDPSGK